MQKTIWTTIAALCLGYSQARAQHRLEDYIQQAVQNSPLLKDYTNQQSVNALESERLKAFYTKAQVSLNANYLFAPIVSTDNNHTKLELAPQTANQYYGFDVGLTNGALYQGLVNYTQPLLGKPRYETAAAQVAVTSEISGNNRKLSQHDLEKQVTDQYILCLSDKSQLQFTDSMTSLLQEQQQIVQKLVAASLLKQSDLTLLHIEYENNQALSATWQASYKRDLQDLNLICGIRDTATVMLESVQLPQSASPDSSAFLTKYRLDSLNLQMQQKIFDLKYKPQLNLAVNAGVNAVYLPDIAQRLGFSAGLNFIVPIYDGHQRRITHKKTSIQLQTNELYKNNFQLQNEVRVHKIATELGSYRTRIGIAQKQLQEYESLLSQYKKEILQGQLSIINYITVIKSRMALQRDFLLLKSNEQLLINSYNYWNW